MEKFLTRVVQDDLLHAKWLNTLSMMENCGARLIARCEHPTLVKEEMLKHAAEEFRHAFHLKKQIQKLKTPKLPTYEFPFLLGGWRSLHYLPMLNGTICRYLKSEAGLTGNAFNSLAYLLVTYAVEMRASVLYPCYQTLLKAYGSKVSVQSIVLEEEGHLQEMVDALACTPRSQIHMQHALRLEDALYTEWIAGLPTSAV
jgi:hypothetical protein